VFVLFGQRLFPPGLDTISDGRKDANVRQKNLANVANAPYIVLAAYATFGVLLHSRSVVTRVLRGRARSADNAMQFFF
jgi:hypothetical protein